jgi:putative oxidoreductase
MSRTRAPEVREKAQRVDARVRPLLDRIGVPLLRISLGLVFLWFGLLKIFDVSPVSELVAKTIYWFDPDVVVPALGAFEVFVGACLVAGRLMRVALPLLVLQMAGTFLVLVLLPGIAFRDGNPLLLTVQGEFVIKNLVLLSAALVIGSRLAPLGEGGTGSA